jgi:hypothetical protein
MVLASAALVPLPLLLLALGGGGGGGVGGGGGWVWEAARKWAAALLPFDGWVSDAAAAVAAAMPAGARDRVLLPGVYAAIGFASFAPHVLNGLAARELAPPGVSASAGGFTKALGQAGGALAGLPLGRFAAARGWPAVLLLLAAAAAASTAAAVPLWGATAWQPGGAGTAAAAGDGPARKARALDSASLSATSLRSPRRSRSRSTATAGERGVRRRAARAT